MRYTLILAALLSCSAQAQTIGIHGFSEHGKDTYTASNSTTSVERKFNEKNFGAYVILDNGLTAGFYRNSYWKQTAYIGYSHNFRSFGPVTPSLTAAIATGYQEVFGIGKLRLMVMPSLTVQTGYGTAVRYSFAPSGQGVFQHLSIERKF